MVVLGSGSVENSTGLQGSASNKIPKHSSVYTYTPPHLPDPLRFFEVLAPRLNPCDVMHTPTYPSSIAGSLQSVSQILMSPAKTEAGPTLDLVQQII